MFGMWVRESALLADVLAAVTMKTIVSWDATPCCLVDAYRRFRGTCHLNLSTLGTEAAYFLRNIGKYLADYTALHHVIALFSLKSFSAHKYINIIVCVCEISLF
jgi:hypothetical protein